MKPETPRKIELQMELESLKKRIKNYEHVIQYCYDACLCERFETYGFDFHEKHPKFGNKGGSRSKTPKVLIEDWIGFDWRYDKPKGPCNSWKELRLSTLDVEVQGGRTK